MKAAKGIAVGLLIAVVLFLSIYALFPEKTADPVVNYISPSISVSKEEESKADDSKEERSSSSSTSRSGSSSSSSKPPKSASSESSVTSSEASSSETPSSEISAEPEINFPLNINAATEEELLQIDGITEELARLIVLYREMAGGFVSTEDLKKISQMSYGTYDKIKDYIYCE